MEKTNDKTLPQIEEEILDFWQKEKIFEKSLGLRKESPRFSFYDGPPFATGSPHYGHIVASVIKDVVPRYWTMKGKYVERVWGWDCHGLPIENIAEKELGITQKKQIEEIGVDKFEQECRSRVLSYVSEWEKVIPRLGRWVDMKNAYKTMDLPFMESVWWVFKELWDKGLIYEGYRSMYICPRCETTLSQSEVAEGYRDVKDLSVIAKFELEDELGTYLLAWTTTPWTLIGNVALAINPGMVYCKIKDKKEKLLNPSRTLRTGKLEEYYILAKDRLGSISGEYEILSEFSGEELVGKRYKPLFDYYNKPETKNSENGWKVYPADFVTEQDGTGIVHIAPAFGEDDMELGKEFDLPFIQHVGMDGVIKPEVKDFAGMHVKPTSDVQKTDVEIIKYLANKGLLFYKEQFEHSYPHCWRCDTPLINYATSSWFVSVAKVKEEALKLAKEINWSPKYIKEGRFGNWLEGARDWSISRQRYWASVIPIWRCSAENGGCGEIQVFGSVGELEKASGKKIDDLHKFAMDKIEVPCKCGGVAKRIPDVLDTWFDSGSMPYAQIHYPFENKEKFEKSFPADFIGEGVDQTRCWFYYLHVIATAIKDKIPYKNVVVNGIVLAEDGKKMSKKLQNYPDPTAILDKYGADVLRLYLLSSPVMAGENLNFSEKEMAEFQRGIFRMLWNSFEFFNLYREDWQSSDQYKPVGLLDRWIISELNQLIVDVNRSMENYDLNRAARSFQPFVDNLSNWYIRRSRKRFGRSEDHADRNSAFGTLSYVLVELAKLMAPFAPFISEHIFKDLTGSESVHLIDYPEANKEQIDKELSEKMREARVIVEMGLSCRAMLNKIFGTNEYKVRQPLKSLKYGNKDKKLPKLSDEFEEIIKDEVNVKELVYDEQMLGVELDKEITDELRDEGIYREIVRQIQDLRKVAGYKAGDKAVFGFQTEDIKISNLIKQKSEDILQDTATRLSEIMENVDCEKEIQIEGKPLRLMITK
ncbi:MAG: isoleucine--tRNA ligase [bacterium]|nr:isoleucine--tRNA ligase [bacterium]